MTTVRGQEGLAGRSHIIALAVRMLFVELIQQVSAMLIGREVVG